MTTKWLLFFDDNDTWGIKDAFEGTQIFGATGSGKTSGSGRQIAIAMLKAGFGGLVLTVKADESALWRRYAKAAGREKDLILFGPNHPYRFNFLEYEKNASFTSALGLTDNIVAMFCAVVEVAQRSAGHGGGGQDAYWMLALKQLLRNAIDLLRYGKQQLSFQSIYRVVTSAPPSLDAVSGKGWRENSLCWDCLQAIDVPTNHPDADDVILIENYWLREFPALAPETRSIVMSYFTSMADPFLRGVLRTLFSSTDSTAPQLAPELSHQGKILVLELPVKRFNEMGQFAQVLYKYCWQRATEKRDPKAEGQRPVFLWADEAQFFVNSHDMLFQTTARSAQVATVYLTQNISNYYAIMPGEKGRAETDSLLGNFQTKIFHANGDAVTNLWAADTIGKYWDYRVNRSSSVGSRDSKDGGNSSSQFSSSQVETLEHQVLPIEFSMLSKGGEENDRQVQAIIFQGGRTWSNGRNFLRTVFTQEDLQ